MPPCIWKEHLAAGYAGIKDIAESIVEKSHCAVGRKLTNDIFQDTDKTVDKGWMKGIRILKQIDSQPIMEILNRENCRLLTGRKIKIPFQYSGKNHGRTECGCHTGQAEVDLSIIVADIISGVQLNFVLI